MNTSNKQLFKINQLVWYKNQVWKIADHWKPENSDMHLYALWSQDEKTEVDGWIPQPELKKYQIHALGFSRADY
ncbi:hypothetical protein [Methanolobus sp. WCC4]|uniref:hypothetical protein n=1 Tax=Methanolobus sp. WCC4 TaxID=3125784 RepID=UPI0030F66869